jgi:hypothetical protein
MDPDLEGLEVHRQAAPETKIVKRLEMDPVVIICHSKLRYWAVKNALTIVFLNLYFGITWGVIIIAARAW